MLPHQITLGKDTGIRVNYGLFYGRLVEEEDIIIYIGRLCVLYVCMYVGGGVTDYAHRGL